MASIRDVAKKAGVSSATVSHVINKTRYVSSDLVEKVEAAVKEVGYNKKIETTQNTNKRNKILCFILPDSSQPLMAELIRHVDSTMFMKGYSIVVTNTLYDLNREHNLLKTIRSKMMDGILIIPSTNTLLEIDEFDALRIPVVSIDREILNGEIDCVVTDNEKAGFIAAEHLIKLGHKHIGFIDRTTDQSHNIERREGFIQALAKYQLPLYPNLIIRAENMNFKDGGIAAEKLLRQTPRPTAIIALNDDLAIGATKKATSMGLKVPEDLSIIGYGNTTFGEEYTPSLTTIDYPADEIARKACDLLINRISQIQMKGEKIIESVSAHQLITRESTAALSKQ